MQKILALSVLVVGIAATGSCALAAEPVTTKFAEVPAAQASATTSFQTRVMPRYQARPVFRLFGVPAMVWAPVPPPYSAEAYSNLGGQPEAGTDIVLAQGAHGMPMNMPRVP